MTGILQSLLGSVSSAVAVVTDAYFNLVTLLLPGNGTNGAQNNTFLDSSTNNFTITRNGNTTQGTFTPFSQTGWSNYFNGSTDYLTPSSSPLALGSGAYTVEFWINPASLGAGAHVIAANATNGFVVVVSNAKIAINKYGVGDLVAYNTALTTNTWTHVALVRTGTGTNQTQIYVNGVSVATGTDSNNWTVTSTTAIGANSSGAGSQYFNGYLSNLRICGVAVYTSTFTPSTTPLTTTSQGASSCTFLTCQDSRFKDNGSTAATFTVGGTPSVQAFSPFAPTAAYSAATNGGSGYFDASGDYLSISDASNLASPGSGDFTAQCWLYVPSLPNNLLGASAVYHLKNDTGTATTVFIIEITSGGAMNLSTGTALIASGTAGYVKAGAWNHLFVSRLSGTLRTFVNGTADISVANSTTYNGSVVQIGAWRYSTSDFSINGYIGGFRFQKGTGYSSVTIPTAPYTAITNTSLLLNFTNAGITDATAKNVLETVGNAQISTTQSKFGGSSIYLDGTGDWLLFPSSQTVAFGTGDFTIEFWYYTSTTSGFRGLFSTSSTDGETGTFRAYLNNANTGMTMKVGTTDTSFTQTLTANAWVHLAFVRSGGTLAMYYNGTKNGTTASITNDILAKRLIIGANFIDGTEPFTGYFDDIRISKYARYTATFTPPTAAFPLS